MALSFSAVEKAYEVLNALNVKDIPSWPEDMAQWDDEDLKKPKENTVYGFGKKSDWGWENLVFFVRNPSPKLKRDFKILCKKVPNTCISKPYSKNTELWIFGWF